MRKTLMIYLMALGLTAQAEHVRIFSTTADGTETLKYKTQETAGTLAANRIRLMPSTEYQSMDGFGYGLTYSSCYNLLKMNPRDRHEFLRKTFSQETGLGVSYCRISIGCSDFSSRVYTLCDTRDIKNFALQSVTQCLFIAHTGFCHNMEIIKCSPASFWGCFYFFHISNSKRFYYFRYIIRTKYINWISNILYSWRNNRNSRNNEFTCNNGSNIFYKLDDTPNGKWLWIYWLFR